jgi:ABC-type dipeptide/oligopeptide/nickel transport system ATPase subunit
MIIGILGRSRVGKDTVASCIIQHLGPTNALILRLSQPLKDAVKTLYGFTTNQLEDDTKDIVDPRFGLTPREVIQHICSDTMSRHGQDFFSRKLYYEEALKYPNQTIIVPDVRYAHDICMIREQGGFVIKVVRPQGSYPRHPCEEAIDHMEGDYLIINDRHISDVEKKVKEILEIKGLVSQTSQPSSDPS